MTEHSINSIIERLTAKAITVGTVSKNLQGSTIVQSEHRIEYTIARKVAGVLYREMGFINGCYGGVPFLHGHLANGEYYIITLERKSDTETRIKCVVSYRKRYRSKAAAVAACVVHSLSDLMAGLATMGTTKDRLDSDWSYANAE